jgi:hypothetical protein
MRDRELRNVLVESNAWYKHSLIPCDAHSKQEGKSSNIFYMCILQALAYM